MISEVKMAFSKQKPQNIGYIGIVTSKSQSYHFGAP